MWITLIVLALAMIFFVNGKVRSDMVALGALIALMLFDILTPEEALSGFSSSILIMMIGLFIVGGGIFQTGLAHKISRRIMKLAGSSPWKLYLLVMLTTAFVGAFVSNTGTVAMMLPIVVSLAASANISASRLLMPLAFASSMGGMMTLIGTPPNLVISNELERAGFEPLSFFSFTPVGIIAVVLGVLLLWPLSKRFLSDKKDKASDQGKKSFGQLANEYQLSSNLYRMRIKENSLFENQTLQTLDISNRYNVSVLEIRRRQTSKSLFTKTVNQKVAGAQTKLIARDVLYVMGDFTNVKKMLEDNGLEWLDSSDTVESAPVFAGKLRFDEIGIGELVILSNSLLVNQKVKNTGFREKFQVNILGIQRSNKYILQNVKDEKIQAGDVLLIQGEWKDIARLNEDNPEWVVVGQPLKEASEITLDHKAPLAAIILLAMVAALAFNIVPAVTAVLLAALLMILFGCLRSVEAAYQTINWESIVLIGAMLPMSLALEKTGVSLVMSNLLVNVLGNVSPWLLLAGIYVGTSILTMFISNTATAVLFAPIALHAALDMGVSPYAFLFAVTVAASMCFASPFSTPPNALVMSAGRYTFMDYVRVGLPLQILFGIVMICVLPLLFPF